MFPIQWGRGLQACSQWPSPAGRGHSHLSPNMSRGIPGLPKTPMQSQTGEPPLVYCWSWDTMPLTPYRVIADPPLYLTLVFKKSSRVSVNAHQCNFHGLPCPSLPTPHHGVPLPMFNQGDPGAVFGPPGHPV